MSESIELKSEAPASVEGEQSGAPRVPRTKKSRDDAKKLKARTTVYDEKGNWEVYQHHKDLRQIENAVFTKYYRDLQRITPDWDGLMKTLRTPLPTTVWINDTDPLAADISNYFMSLVDQGLVVPIDWYPVRNMAFRIKSDKTAFRKAPEMQPLRQYLIRQTALGTVSRQEEVSMIPPLLLEIKSTDVCLDMCASPGSKTAQMLVALARHKAVPFSSDRSPFPFDYLSSGMIMANELDAKRANMLVHQVKRMRLLFPFALFTNHDARFFPDLLHRPAALEMGDSEALGEVPDTPLQFDKILCDVVCSGDGTIRKAPFIFKVWSPREAINLQKTQVQIALRGCHLLKVGGRLVYSTCSLNPIENEAVVSQIVQRTSGAMRLVDPSTILPRLSYDKGLTTWVVTDKKGEPVAQPSDDLHPALFPLVDCPHDLDLTKCMRFLPHHCDGGGFFIAVLEKVKPFSLPPPRATAGPGVEGGEAVGDAKVGEGSERSRPPMKRSREKDVVVPGALSADAAEGRGGHPRPERIPPHFVRPSPEMLKSLTDFYRIRDFPTKNLIVRTANNERVLTVTHNTTCSLVANTPLSVLLRQQQGHLVVVSAGLRLLAHEHLDDGWRIAYESAILFVKLMKSSPRVVRLTIPQAVQLIHAGKLKDVSLEDIEDPSLQAQLNALSVGTVLLLVDCPFDKCGFVPAVGLRARTRLQLLVDHEDLVGFQLRLGLDVTGSELQGAENDDAAGS